VYDSSRREAAVGVTRSGRVGDALARGIVAARDAAYTGKFTNWYTKATVRSRPRRVLGRPAPEQIYFSPELVPAASHPLVARLGPGAARDLLVHHLYQYLSFTVELEETAVMPVVTALARGRSGLTLPPGMREDAFKIATDEAWHAQFSYDLIRQVESATGVPYTEDLPPAFTGRLTVIRESFRPDLAGMASLLFAVVSETLISRILSGVPRDERLPQAVRAAVGDHAQDEGRHHSYFREILDVLWAQLSPEQRREIGPRVPELIYAFLEPDYPGAGLGLARIGLPAAQCEAVLTECYPASTVRADVADAAKSTIRYFCEVGALDDTRTREAFIAGGLLATGQEKAAR
jgi:para-aminobenzoate N-oxygenase AurF